MSLGGAVVGEVKIRVSFDSGKAKPESKNLGRSISNLTKSAHSLGRGFERMGRTISITGFVMGIVARRVIGAFEGIAKSIIKISEEGANLDKAFTFLGDTLTALALSGMLTDDVMARILGTFQEMFDIAMKSAGPWAIINDAIQQFKNAIALGAIPALTDLSTFLAGFDLGPFKAALAEATTTFLIPIIAKIKELLGDENSGVIGIKEKLNAIAAIGGSFLAGVLGGFDQVMTKAAELIGNDAKGITGLAYILGEKGAWALVAAPFMAVVGMIVGGFGTILTAITSLVALIGGVGTAGLLGVLTLVIIEFDRWEDSIGNLFTAIGNLANILEIDLSGAINIVISALQIFGAVIRTPINYITRFLEMITAAIRKVKEFAALTSQPSGGISGGPIGERQGGGMIHKTGTYMLHQGERVVPRNQVSNNYGTNNFYISGGDPRVIAEEVGKILASQSRRSYMPI